MGFTIIVDSSCEIPSALKEDGRIQKVPFGLQVGNWYIQDDANFDQEEFLKRVAEYEGVAKSACPSPDGFRECIEKSEAERVYIITISSHLSGSYNSAKLGVSIYEEDHEDRKIHVFDSESTAGGETNLLLRIIEKEEAGLEFEEIVKEVESFRDQQKTYFVLDNLETLKKNGRLTGVKALLASTLNIKPVMGSHKGEIIMKGQAMGMKKALMRIADHVAAEVKEEAGLEFEEIVKEVESFRDQQKTYFVLDNLETLKKNGRLTGVKALLASTLNIKPVMGSHKGEIIMKGQAMGMKKALMRIADHVAAEVKDPQERVLIISHCNCPDRAEQLQKYVEAKVSFKQVLILETSGLNSLYANDGGVIVNA